MTGPEESEMLKKIDEKLKRLKIKLNKGCVRCDEDEKSN